MPHGTEALDTRRQPRLQAAVELAGGNHHQCHSRSTADISHAPAARWACVYTQPQAERWANTNLRRLGYVTYLPMVTVLKRDKVVRSMQHSVSMPLFARYLFLQFDHTLESWSPIRACPGVVDLVRSGGTPDYARAGAVEALQRLEAGRATIPQSDAWTAPGAAVGVSSGILAGQHGVILRRGEKSATVALLMLGHLREVRCPISLLVPYVAE